MTWRRLQRKYCKRVSFFGLVWVNFFRVMAYQNRRSDADSHQYFLIRIWVRGILSWDNSAIVCTIYRHFFTIAIQVFQISITLVPSALLL